jgi:hypothetical protein
VDGAGAGLAAEQPADRVVHGLVELVGDRLGGLGERDVEAGRVLGRALERLSSSVDPRSPGWPLKLSSAASDRNDSKPGLQVTERVRRLTVDPDLEVEVVAEA